MKKRIKFGADGFSSSMPSISCVDMLCVSDLLYKFMLYMQVPVRVAGGLLFELLGQSVGDPNREEEDIPIVLRSWQTQNFLLTAMHVKGLSSNINVLGVTEVQVSIESLFFLNFFNFKMLMVICAGVAYCWWKSNTQNSS